MSKHQQTNQTKQPQFIQGEQLYSLCEEAHSSYLEAAKDLAEARQYLAVKSVALYLGNQDSQRLSEEAADAVQHIGILEAAKSALEPFFVLWTQMEDQRQRDGELAAHWSVSLSDPVVKAVVGMLID